MTTSGKTDRQKRQPTTQQLWAGVLTVAPDSVGLDDSFFCLDGDSIAVMKLVGDARRAGIQLTVANLFRNPKLVALASLDSNSTPSPKEAIPAFSLLGEDADATQVRKQVAVSCGVDTSLIEDIYPCSPLQKDAFRAAWEHVVRSTATLRTRTVQHNKLGLLRTAMEEGIQWVEAEDVEEYLQKDKSVSMELGKPPGFHTFIKYLGQQDQDAAATYWQAALTDRQATPFPPLPPTVQQPVTDATITYQCPPVPKATSDTTTPTLIRAAQAIFAGRTPTRTTWGDQTVSAFLHNLHQQSTEMIAYEQTGLQQIAKMAAGAREDDGVLGEWRGRSELQDFTAYALTVQYTLAAEGVQIAASFDQRVVEEWLVKKMLSQFSFILLQLASADKQANIASIDTLTPEDRERLCA
ncbi:PP-binding domain containing protein [Pyrenophora teres f. maculata]|nr:PP-binding domain containing protein [Pyrenophora teres f. maculata]